MCARSTSLVPGYRHTGVSPSCADGTAWKKERTVELVITAVRSGFRAIDTACQPKHYREDLVGEALTRLAEEVSARACARCVRTAKCAPDAHRMRSACAPDALRAHCMQPCARSAGCRARRAVDPDQVLPIRGAGPRQPAVRLARTARAAGGSAISRPYLGHISATCCRC